MQTVFRRAYLFAVFSVLGTAASAEWGSRARGDEPERIAFGPLVVSGTYDQRYQFRSAGDETDQDLYGYLGLEARHQSKEPRSTRSFRDLTFRFQGSYNLDLDPGRETNAGSTSGSGPFADLNDSLPDAFDAYLHAAYLEARDVNAFDRLRVGRQTLYREEGFFFDGLFARTEPLATVALEFFGGLPTRLYERSASGDALVGAGLSSEPTPGLVVGANYIFERDRREGRPDSEDNFWLLHGRYRIGEEWTARGSASWEGSRDRRQRLELQYLSSAVGFDASLRATRQNGIVEFHADDISPYVLVQGAYAPYYEYAFDAHQPLGEHFGVGGGVHLRHLQDSADAGIFNHSFRNYYLSLDSRELWNGGRASLRGDAWDADGEDIYSAGFEVEQRIAKLLRARVGTSYSLYRFDPFTGQERDRDRLYYIKLRWRLWPRIDADTDYQYEKDSRDEYHRLTVGLRVNL